MSLAGVANFVRVYRQQQAAIEREYQDSFAVASKRRGWTPAKVREWYARPSRERIADADGADLVADRWDRQPARRAGCPGGDLRA